MKRFSLFSLMFLFSTLILVACSNDDAGESSEGSASDNGSEIVEKTQYQPADIDPDVDTCDVCGMAIADDEHATQIILTNDRSLKFDDIGDMFVWIEENGEEDIGAKFVRDFHTKEWLELEDASFVYDEEIMTPMGFGVISFKESEEAEQYIEESGLGQLLDVADLYEHEWEMSDHDHEDH